VINVGLLVVGMKEIVGAIVVGAGIGNAVGSPGKTVGDEIGVVIVGSAVGVSNAENV
jgi:hypothetical protein